MLASTPTSHDGWGRTPDCVLTTILSPPPGSIRRRGRCSWPSTRPSVDGGWPIPIRRRKRATRSLFTRLPGRAPFAIGLVLGVALLAAPFAFSIRRAGSKRRSSVACAIGMGAGSGGVRKRRAPPGPGRCRGARQGEGVLEWFRDGRLTVRYSGHMEGGGITGRGELTESGTRYEGSWKDGELREGTATYSGGHRYSGKWDRGDWTRGVLTVPGGYRFEERWYEGQLTGKTTARRTAGTGTSGNWTDGGPRRRGRFRDQ